MRIVKTTSTQGTDYVKDGVLYMDNVEGGVLVESESDLVELPDYPPGTIAHVAGWGRAWERNAKGQWIKGSSGGGGGGDIGELTTRVDAIEEKIPDSASASNKLADMGIIAEEFLDSKDYKKGEYVYHNNILYRFDVNHDAGEWAILQVTEVNVMNEILANGINESTELILHTLSAEEMLAELEA